MPVLDLSLLQFFMPVFSFLLIFALVYAVMDKFSLLGGGNSIKLLVSTMIALIFLFSTSALEFVTEILPWFVVLIVLIFIILAALMFMGLKEESVVSAAKQPGLYWVVLAFIIVALLITIGKVFGSISGEEDEAEGDEGGSTLLQTFFNAKVLGAIVLLIIAVFAIQNITKPMET